MQAKYFDDLGNNSFTDGIKIKENTFKEEKNLKFIRYEIFNLGIPRNLYKQLTF